MTCAIYVCYINIVSDSSGNSFDSYLEIEYLCEQENLLTYSSHQSVMAFFNKIVENHSVKGKMALKHRSTSDFQVMLPVPM